MKPIQLNFKPSITFEVLFSLMIINVYCILMLLAIASQIKFILLALIISTGSYAVLKHGLRLLPSACVSLKIDINNQLKLIRKDGKILELSLQKHTTVTPYLTILNSQIKERSWLKYLFKQHLVIPLMPWMPSIIGSYVYGCAGDTSATISLNRYNLNI